MPCKNCGGNLPHETLSNKTRACECTSRRIMTAERIEEIQAETSYLNSICVQQALLKVWNECEQERSVTAAELNAMGVSCGTCPHYEMWGGDAGDCKLLGIMDDGLPEYHFCSEHPKLRGEE